MNLFIPGLVCLDLSLTDPKVIGEPALDTSGGDEAFLCCICKTKISEKKYLVSISGDTPYHTFMNPYGYSYNVMTLIYCEMVKESSGPVNEHTWFPGYVWSILACAGCMEHLGWRFISADRQPAAFYALIRDKLVLAV